MTTGQRLRRAGWTVFDVFGYTLGTLLVVGFAISAWTAEAATSRLFFAFLALAVMALLVNFAVRQLRR